MFPETAYVPTNCPTCDITVIVSPETVKGPVRTTGGNLPLLIHALNLSGLALTGPVARGDVETIRRHLEPLTKDDALLYRALARAALELAAKAGMDDAAAARVADALATDLPLVMRAK